MRVFRIRAIALARFLELVANRAKAASGPRLITASTALPRPFPRGGPSGPMSRRVFLALSAPFVTVFRGRWSCGRGLNADCLVSMDLRFLACRWRSKYNA